MKQQPAIKHPSHLQSLPPPLPIPTSSRACSLLLQCLVSSTWTRIHRMPAKKVSHSGSIQGPVCSGKQRKPEWNHSHPIPAGCVRLQTFFLVFLCVCVCVCVFHSSLSLARDTPSLSLEPIPRDSNRLACYCVLLCPNCRGTLDLWNVGLFPPLLLVSRSVVRCATQYPAQCLMPGPVLSDWLAGPPACIGCLPGVVFCQSSSRWTRAGIGGWRGGCFDGQAADWLRVGLW